MSFLAGNHSLFVFLFTQNQTKQNSSSAAFFSNLLNFDLSIQSLLFFAFFFPAQKELNFSMLIFTKKWKTQMVTVFLAANILKRNQLAVKNDYDT